MSRYKPYPAYKDSGVEWIGKVPEHWDVKAFKRLASIRNGQDYKDVADPNGAYPVIGSGGEFARASSFMFNGESVLLGRKGTIDKPLYINGPFWAVDTMFYTTIADDASPRFVYYSALNIPFGLYSTNTALPSMTGEDISSHLIPAPDLAEQEAIAAFLDRETARIDALIAKKTEFIELLARKRQALITHAVTKGLDPNVKMKDSGVEWIGEVPEHWDISPFFTVAKEISRSNKGMIESKVLSLSFGRIIQKRESENLGLVPESYETYQIVEPGEIVFRFTDLQNDKNSLRSAQVKERGIITSAYLAIKPFNVNETYLAWLMRAYDHCKVFYTLGGGLRQSLKYSDVKRLPVVIPPLVEQLRSVDFIDHETARIDLLIEKVQLSIDLLKKRRSALITAAVTGQIDLREST